MIVHNVKQGTPEWFAARAGVISGSNFKLARERVGGLDEKQQIFVDTMLRTGDEAQALAASGYKKRPSAQLVERALRGEKTKEISPAARKHAFKLALERIAGMPQGEEFSVWQARRGQELEPMARMKHELKLGIMVEEAGFITTDDNRFGVSVDGLIESDGGAEYKCFLDPEKLMDFYLESDFSTVMDQVQGGMWLTGRKYWHLGLYYPGLEGIGGDLLLARIERDEAYIEALEEDLLEFMHLVDDYEARVRARIAQGMLVGFDVPPQITGPEIRAALSEPFQAAANDIPATGDAPAPAAAPVAPHKSWRSAA